VDVSAVSSGLTQSSSSGSNDTETTGFQSMTSHCPSSTASTSLKTDAGNNRKHIPVSAGLSLYLYVHVQIQGRPKK